MISVAVAVVGVIGTYAVLRNRVARIEYDYEQHIIESTEYKKDTLRRLDAGFKRIDGISDRATILERDTEKLLDLETAEKKFVTRVEMTLHLEKIEIVTANIDKEVGRFAGKQNEMFDLLNQIKDKN